MMHFPLALDLSSPTVLGVPLAVVIIILLLIRIAGNTEPAASKPFKLFPDRRYEFWPRFILCLFLLALFTWLYVEALPKIDFLAKPEPPDPSTGMGGGIDGDVAFMKGVIVVSCWLSAGGALLIWIVPDKWFRW